MYSIREFYNSRTIHIKMMYGLHSSNRLDHKIDLTKKSRSIGNYLDAMINSAWYYPLKKSSWDSSDRDRFIF